MVCKNSTQLRGRLHYELKTIKAMITMYCRAHHGTDDKLCSGCSELLHYAARRIHKCPFQQKKPTCGNCQIHCYKPAMRESIIMVMRFSGPRMALKHPLLALRHLIDSRRKAPVLNKKNITRRRQA